MAITVAATLGVLGSIALFEGLAAFLEHMEGNPEADVQVALQQLASRNQRRAFSIAAAEQAGKEDIEQNFAGFNQIPSRVLSQASLSRQRTPRTAQDSELLDFVAARLQVPASELSRISSPARMGDMSQVYRRLGKSLPSQPPTQGQ